MCKLASGVINIVLIVMNLMILTGGILILVYGSSAPKEPKFVSTCSYLIGVGVIITAIFGIIIACTVKCILIQVFACALLLCVLGEIAVGIICTVLYRSTDDRKFKELRQHYDNYHTDSNSTKIIDDIQQKYECCGNSGPEDPAVVDRKDKNKLISSCCPDTPEKKDCTKELAYRKSCSTEAAKGEKEHLKSLSIIGWFFGIASAVSLVFVCVLKQLSCFL